MIEDILYMLNNRISVGLTDENNQTFLFSSCSVDNNQVTFTDSIDNVQYTVNIAGVSILTFSDKSIPYAADIDEFKKAVLI